MSDSAGIELCIIAQDALQLFLVEGRQQPTACFRVILLESACFETGEFVVERCDMISCDLLHHFGMALTEHLNPFAQPGMILNGSHELCIPLFLSAQRDGYADERQTKQHCAAPRKIAIEARASPPQQPRDEQQYD